LRDCEARIGILLIEGEHSGKKRRGGVAEAIL
jgi:hypothetical protein